MRRMTARGSKECFARASANRRQCTQWAARHPSRPWLANDHSDCLEATMIFDYSLSGLVTVGLTIYLTYVLLRPERF